MRTRLNILLMFVLITGMIVSCGKSSDSELLVSGKRLELSGNYEKALTNYDVLVDAHPESPLRAEALCRSGLIRFIRHSDTAGAAEYFRKVTREYPDEVIGDGCRALLEFIQSDSAANPVESLYNTGLAYTNLLQDFDIGIEMLNSLVEQYPDHKRAPEALFMSGFIYANSTADTAEARTYYKRFLERYPDHTLASSVKWELEYLGRDINTIPEMQHIDQTELK